MTNASEIQLTPEAPSGSLVTALSSNGFHILWDVVDSDGVQISDLTGVELIFNMVLPGGGLEPFDVSPVSASEKQVLPTQCGGGVEVRVSSTTLPVGSTALINMYHLY